MSENVYSSFVNTVCNVLIGNIKTQTVGNDCLQMWTTSNQELNDSWVSNPVAELADPTEAWNPVTNPYVPEGYTYPDDGTVITTTGSDGKTISYWQCNYDPTKTGSDTANEQQVQMTNGLNAAQNPDEMNNFIYTYGPSGDYTDDWSESFATTVTMQQSAIYNPNDSTNPSSWSTTQSENLSEMNSWSSFISSTAQEETTPGKNQASQQNSMMQTLSNYQQVIAQMGDAVVGVIKATVSAMQKTL